jgi:hypothetical protein
MCFIEKHENDGDEYPANRAVSNLKIEARKWWNSGARTGLG